MAKAATIKIKLLSTADTGTFYVTEKNARTKTDKLELQEVRSRSCASMSSSRKPRSSNLIRLSSAFAWPDRAMASLTSRTGKSRPSHGRLFDSETERWWPAGSGCIEEATLSTSEPADPTDPGDAADLSTP